MQSKKIHKSITCYQKEINTYNKNRKEKKKKQSHKVHVALAHTQKNENLPTKSKKSNLRSTHSFPTRKTEQNSTSPQAAGKVCAAAG